ncbi:MAG: hypothetical protein ACE5GR_03490 [Nitrosopumilus sp.]
MVSQPIWIGIVIVTFFIGIGVSYAHFANIYDPMSMKFQNQKLFDQMMANNPKMSQQWIDSGMMNQQQMQQMMNDPRMQQQMIDMMMQNPDMVNTMSNMQFSTDAPMIMPMIDGYYNGEKMFFIHTEVSDNNMAQMMSTMINFPTLYVSDLKNIPQSEMSKVYVFTNGIAGSEPYGGGPFMFQIDVFDSIPGQMGYSQFRVPHLVTWNDNSTPRIMTSEAEILEAESNEELTIQKTDNVVNAPMIVWKSDGMEQKTSMVERMFESMPGVNGEITNVDVENYLVMMKLHSKSNMDMMDSGMMKP